MNKKNFIAIVSASLILSACSSRGVKYYNVPENTTNKNYFSDPYKSTLDKKEYDNLKLKPYIVRGVRYNPKLVSIGEKYYGISSWYGPDFDGKATCNGEIYNMHAMTAAHKTFPMNTIVRVTNKNNGLSAIVRINDRGPFVGSRIIDLSNAAARKIDMVGTGTAPVELEIIGVNGVTNNLPSVIEVKKKSKNESMPIENNSNIALQIGLFSNIQSAISIQEKYDKIDGYKTIIKDIYNGEDRVFKVWLVGFKSEQEARNYKNQGNFKNSFIVNKE